MPPEHPRAIPNEKKGEKKKVLALSLRGTHLRMRTTRQPSFPPKSNNLSSEWPSVFRPSRYTYRIPIFDICNIMSRFYQFIIRVQNIAVRKPVGCWLLLQVYAKIYTDRVGIYILSVFVVRSWTKKYSIIMTMVYYVFPTHKRMAAKSTSYDFYNVHYICTDNNSRILDSYSPGTVVSCRTSKMLAENPPCNFDSYPMPPKNPFTVISFASLSSIVRSLLGSEYFIRRWYDWAWCAEEVAPLGRFQAQYFP